jgi:hypothetical protein
MAAASPTAAAAADTGLAWLSSSPIAPTDTTGTRPAALRTRIYFGMWSTHFRDLNEGLDGNSLIGLSYRGFFGATFINSFGDRAVGVGMQRSLSTARSGFLTPAFGYRAGLVTGYDERFFGVGDKTPVIPFVQFIGSIDVRNLGVEIAWAGIVASVTMNWRL